jgi:hypothetical protein
MWVYATLSHYQRSNMFLPHQYALGLITFPDLKVRALCAVRCAVCAVLLATQRVC